MLPKYMRVARRLGKSGLLVSRKMLDGWHHLQDNYHLLDLSALRHFGYTVGSLDEGENAGRPFIIWYPDDVVTPAGNIFEDRLYDIGEGPRIGRGVERRCEPWRSEEPATIAWQFCCSMRAGAGVQKVSERNAGERL